MAFLHQQFKAPLERLAKRIHVSGTLEWTAQVIPARAAHSKLAAFARKIWKECRIADAIDKAAQVSCYFALSCFPFLLVLAGLLGWFHRNANWHAFWYWLSNYFPPGAQLTVLDIMLNLSKGFKGFLSFGLFLALWSASSGFMSLMDALSHVYGGKETRSYVKRRILAIVATILAAVFLVICFGI